MECGDPYKEIVTGKAALYNEQKVRTKHSIASSQLIQRMFLDLCTKEDQASGDLSQQISTSPRPCLLALSPFCVNHFFYEPLLSLHLSLFFIENKHHHFLSSLLIPIAFSCLYCLGAIVFDLSCGLLHSPQLRVVV